MKQIFSAFTILTITVFVTHVNRNDVDRPMVFIILVTRIDVLSVTNHYTKGVIVIVQVLMDCARFVVMKCVQKEMVNATALTTMVGVSFVEDIDVQMIVSIHLLSPRIPGVVFVDGVLEKSALLLAMGKIFATLFLTNTFAFVA